MESYQDVKREGLLLKVEYLGHAEKTDYVDRKHASHVLSLANGCAESSASKTASAGEGARNASSEDGRVLR